MDRFFLIGLLLLGLLVLLLRKFDWSQAIKDNAWVIVLLGYMLMSILWSDLHYVSLKRWVRELLAIVMAFVVLSEKDPRKALQSILIRTVYILIPFSLLLIKYFPEYGRKWTQWEGTLMWIGVTLQKNSFGRLCIISAFFLLWMLFRRWKGVDIAASKWQTPADMLVLITTLYLLKGPPGVYPATASVAFGIGVAGFLGLLWMKERKRQLNSKKLPIFLAVVIAFGCFTVMAQGSIVGNFTSALGRDGTLTGRTEIWAILLPIAMHRPLLGHGIGGFWTYEKAGIFDFDECHSGYLEVFLHLGLIGLVLVSVFLISSCRKAEIGLRKDFYWSSFWIGFLLITVVFNITESSLHTFGNQMMATLIFLAVTFQKVQYLRESGSAEESVG